MFIFTISDIGRYLIYLYVEIVHLLRVPGQEIIQAV